MDFPWPTLFSPAGFAFAIWGVIYLGELVGVAALVRVEQRDLDLASSRAWFCANVSQGLWCASFRPWALQRLWLSSACLAATTTCLHASQQRPISLSLSPLQEALIVWPRSLHMGWVSAATLINVNAWAGMAAIGSSNAYTVAVLSLFIAWSLAKYYASVGLPGGATAILWALFAVSRGQPVGADALALGQPCLDAFARIAVAMALLAGLAAVLCGQQANTATK